MSVNPLDALAGIAVAAAAAAFLATFSHVLRRPQQALRSAKAERPAFQALYETRDGELGRLITDLDVLAGIEASSSETAGADDHEVRAGLLSPTLAYLDALQLGKLLSLLDEAASDAYWATTQFKQARKRLGEALDVLSRLPSEDNTPTPEELAEALRSVHTGLSSLKELAGRRRLIRHDPQR
jgi:hypothetical protein